MPRQRKQVTAKWLRSKRACPEAIKAFVADWGRGGTPTAEECVKACWRRGEAEWADWLFLKLLPRSLRIEQNDLWFKIWFGPSRARKAKYRRLDYAYAKRLMNL